MDDVCANQFWSIVLESTEGFLNYIPNDEYAAFLPVVAFHYTDWNEGTVQQGVDISEYPEGFYSERVPKPSRILSMKTKTGMLWGRCLTISNLTVYCYYMHMVC